MARNETVELVQGLAGVDLFREATQIDDTQFRKLKNFYPPRGSVRILAKRLGSAKYNATAITNALRIDNGARGWKTDGTKKLVVAANRAAGDGLFAGDDIAGTFAEITGGTALPANAKFFFRNWPLLNTLYSACGDGTAPLQKTTNFTTKADVAAPAGLPDARFGQFIELFFTRLVTAKTPTNPTFVYYWDVAAETLTGATQFWRHVEPITALGKNTYGTSDQSLREMLIVFGAHSYGYVAGPPDAAGVTLEQASRVIGCKSPKTVVNTPIGLMFLGSDRMVYLLRSDPGDPEKVGLALRPELLAIPETQLIDACACYHDGFYKLAVVPSGQAANQVQWWGDLDPVLAGESRIDWYGPMEGLSLLCFIVEDGPDDALTLRAGEDGAGTVWKLHQPDTFKDGTTTIVGEILTKEFTEGDPLRQKIWSGFLFGHLRLAAGSLSVEAILDSGRSTSAKILSWTGTGSLWDTMLWDVDPWAAEGFFEDAVNWDSRLVGHSVQLRLTHTVAADFRLRDYARKARTIRRML